MKLAFFINSLNKGGAERTMVHLAEYFFAKGHEVIVVTQYRREQEYAISGGIRRIYSEPSAEELSGNRIKNFICRYRKVRQIWKREKPDLVQAFIGKNNFMAIASTWMLPTRVSVSVVGDPKEEYYTKAMRILAKSLFGFADGIVVKTTDAMQFFPRLLHKKIVVMKNSLNPQFLRTPYEGERDKTVISVGRLDENKNQQMIIRAFAGLADRYPEYRLILYGEGELREALTTKVSELGLLERISLPGAISDVAGMIEKAGIFVLSSNTEGMPNALIEAMALGIPCISTDCPCGGPKDIIQHGENGMLVPVNDSDALANALEKIMKDSALARKLGKNAVKIQELLHPDQTNRAWEEYFRSKIKRSYNGI